MLPAGLRQLDGVMTGQEFEVERLGRGDYRLRRRLPPAKGYFVPVESESTDTL